MSIAAINLARQSQSNHPHSSLHSHYLPPPKENKLHHPNTSYIVVDYFLLWPIRFIFNLQSTTTKQTNTEKLPLYLSPKSLSKRTNQHKFQKAPSVVSDNPSGKPFNEGGNALILDPNHQNGILCHFILGGRTVVSSQTILREKKIDTISRQWGCDKAILLNSPFMQQSD